MLSEFNKDSETKANVALCSFDNIQASVSIGSITVGDAYAVNPFDNFLYYGEVTPNQFAAILEYGLAGYQDFVYGDANLTYGKNLNIDGAIVENCKLTCGPVQFYGCSFSISYPGNNRDLDPIVDPNSIKIYDQEDPKCDFDNPLS